MSSEDPSTTTPSLLSLDVDEDIYDNTVSLDISIFTVIEIVRFIIRLTALASNIYLIVIIVRFMKLRTIINILFFLYAVINIAFLVSSVLVVIIVRSAAADYNTGCLFNVLEKFADISIHFVLTHLAISWYVPNYHPILNSKFPVTFRYGLGVGFLVALIVTTSISMAYCASESTKYYYLPFAFKVLWLAFCGIILISIAILKRYRKPVSDALKTAYAFFIPQIIFAISAVATLLNLLVLIIEFQTGIYREIFFRLIYMEQISSCMDLAEPIVVLYFLSKTNKHFKMAHLKCCKKNLQAYGDDLDARSSSEVPANNVAFNRNSENVWM